MNRFAYLMVTVFALSANPHADMSATSPHPLAGDVEILVGDAPQPRYAHAGRWYVEARKGLDYAIRLRNPYGVRVAVALSVDGLNTIDARETTAAAARKWVLGPYETIVISGWQTSQTEARRFEFTTEPNSYGQALGKTANLGVISARVLPGARDDSLALHRQRFQGSPRAVSAVVPWSRRTECGRSKESGRRVRRHGNGSPHRARRSRKSV